MNIRLLPRDAKFLDLLTTDAENLVEATNELRDFVDKWDRLDARVSRIQALEKRGDELEDLISKRLDDAFITPFDREDIHELAVRMDEVLDLVQSTAETFLIYDVRAPTEESRRLAAIVAEQAAELAEAMRKIERKKDVSAHLAAVHRLEHEADGLSRAAVGQLFRQKMDPLDVIKWRDLYRELENAIDAAEAAAEAIERMLHKSS